MATAYLKIWVAVGKESDVRNAVRRLPGVERADLTTGDQDIIAVIHASDYQALLDAVLSKVRSVEGVERTVTNLVLE